MSPQFGHRSSSSGFYPLHSSSTHLFIPFVDASDAPAELGLDEEFEAAVTAPI